MSDSASRLPARPSLEQLRKQAKELLKAYRAGDEAAAGRFRIALPHLSDSARSGDVMLADAQFVLAREYGFENWAKLVHHIEAITKSGLDQFEQLAEQLAAAYTTGDAMAIRKINWDYGTSFVWDREPERMQQRLPAWADLMGTLTGDGAIKALGGKRNLRRLKTGRMVTDAGLPYLHEIPAFKTLQGGEIKYNLMSFDARSTDLLLDGPFTDQGLASLAGLDGLFGLSFFWHVSAMTAAGLKSLAGLANLGFLGCQGELCNDEAMPSIAMIPRLRMLMGQGTVATDHGFAALSRSETIEYIWGRECPNLGGRGFRALAQMGSLKRLAVSCKNVDDASLSALPRFPALRGLLPMDVPEDGFRHVGRCERLENLWCMYCRETGDIATKHIAGLSHLKTYDAGSTRITDRSLEILSRMRSLEKLEFWDCAGITDAGIAALSRLPHLHEITVSSSPKVTRDGMAVFPPAIRTNLW